MRITRIYYAGELNENAQIILPENTSTHLLKVLRLRSGAELQIFDGQGNEFLAELIDQSAKRAVIVLKKPILANRESPLSIHLAQGIARGEKMDWIIQKAVELGVNKITPLFTDYSEVKLDQARADKRLQHWQAVAVSACEQSGRNYLPQIRPIQSLTAWLKNTDNHLKLILHPYASQRLAHLVKPEQLSITLLVGSEGGFSETEVKMANQNNFISILLGARILRTETAGLAAISAMQTLWGDMG